jgi:hypothetical protein
MGYYREHAEYYGILQSICRVLWDTTEHMQSTTGYYLKGGLVYLTMPTTGTTEDYGGMIFFPDEDSYT